MAKVFITSATGYIGEAVAKALKKHGHDVTALTRSDKSQVRARENGFHTHKGDIKNPESYQERLKEFDIIIHTAAAYDVEFGKTEKATAHAIIEALRNTNKAFIYTSGIWVLGNTGDSPADESRVTNPIDLIRWRADLEKEIMDAASQGVRTVVIRPAIVYGNDGGIFADLIAKAKNAGEVRYVGSADNRWSIVHVDDLAELYVLAAEKAQAGSLYHAAEAAPVKAREYSQNAAVAAGVSGKTKSLTLEEGREIFGPFAEGLALDQHVDAGKARKELGWNPKPRNLAEEISHSHLAGRLQRS